MMLVMIISAGAFAAFPKARGATNSDILKVKAAFAACLQKTVVQSRAHF